MKIEILKIASVISFLILSILGLFVRPQELHNINMVLISIVLTIFIHSYINRAKIKEENKKSYSDILKYSILSLSFSLFGITSKYGYNRIYTSPFTLEIDKSNYGKYTEESLNKFSQGLNDYFEIYNEYPEKLLELNKLDSFNYLKFTTDSWGREIIYTIDENEITLQSAGPDEIMNTSDDIIIKTTPNTA